jgi:gamma-glutamyl:cysteine ligase YbdK (ATP-grasp superfamily)
MALHLTAKLTHGSAKLGLVQPVTSVCRAAFSSSAAAPQLRRRLLTSLSRTPQGVTRQRSSSQQQIRAMAGVTQPSDYAFDIYCKGDHCVCMWRMQNSCQTPCRLHPDDTLI